MIESYFDQLDLGRSFALCKNCEEVNNSPQILATAATDGRPLTRYAANSRSNGAAKSSWRRRELGDQCGRTRELKTKDGEQESLETNDG